ncbi:MAG: RNA methyltransferase [Treponema sp.]|jgi:TrmH RNA methyltransferase|nr:RNA methyltransferase [Treponema sp.]
MHNRLTDELAVCGLNAVRVLGETHPEKINRLFLREDRLPLFTAVCRGLAVRKRPYKLCGNEELERVCKSSHHQGVVAMIIAPVIEGADENFLAAWEKSGKTGLLLCDTGNDHTIGAVIRSAAFFDAPYVVITEPRARAAEDSAEAAGTPVSAERAPDAGDSPPARLLTTSACRTAEGGMEYVEVRSVRNPAAFLRSAGELLVSIGIDSRARVRIRDLSVLLAGQKKRGRILVLGNEETGLPPRVKEQCSFLARIPGTGNIESLGMPQTAALFLQELYER